MILKKLLGEIVHDRYLVTKQQIEEAIKKQREMIKAQMLPERLKRTSLIADARQAMNIDVELLLGKILIDMGYITDEQLDAALKEQDETAQVYDALNSQKLANAMEVGFIVNSTLNLIEVLALIMRHTNLVTNSVASTLMLLDENGDLLFSIPTGPKADKLIDIRIPPGTGIAGWVAVHEQPVLVSNAKEDSRFYPDIDQISGLETQSILCVPLKAKAKLIGVLEVINKADNTFFTNEDYLLLSIFANQAAIAIENARLYGELRDRLAKERQMKQALVEAEKFRALGQMASGVAHDFNNFLSVIMSSAEVAHYDIAENHQARESIDQVLLASRRAKDLVQQIFAFSRHDEPDRRPVQGSQIVEEALQLIRASLPATIELRQHIATHAGTLLADPTQIHQVLMNLCTNAQHAMRETGGVLEVTLVPVTLDTLAVAAHPGLEPGSYIQLSVRDNGDGIDPRIVGQIFDPYFTTREQGVGTGMGLAIVQGVVKNHGGSITVTSEQGVGTTFTVLFPRLEQEREPEV